MLYAINDCGEKALAKPGVAAHCPSCETKMVPKCGEINIWHWAHYAEQACDAWAKDETDWHLGWKALAHPSQVEVPIIKNGVTHIADILTVSGVVIELQTGSISPAMIREREWFYRRILWIFDAREPYNADRLKLRYKGDWWTFRWMHPRKSVAYARCPVFLDLGWNLFQLKRIYIDAPCGGWGRLIRKDDFLKLHLRKKQPE